MPIRFMLDSDELADLTDHAEILATYSDLVTDLPALRRKYPHSTIVLIDRGLGDPTGEATIFDIERGTLTIAEAVRKYDEKVKLGLKYLTVYNDRNNMDAVDVAFGARKPWRIIATLDGTAHIAGLRALHEPAGIQCLSADELGMHGDGTLVFNDEWHPAPKPINTTSLRADINLAQSSASALASDLHRMAALIGG